MFTHAYNKCINFFFPGDQCFEFLGENSNMNERELSIVSDFNCSPKALDKD